MKPLARVILSLLALIIGGVLVFGLTYVGQSTQGPVEDTLSTAGEMVRQVEENIIIKKRSATRKDQLVWMKLTKEALNHPPRILLGAFDEKVATSLKSIFELESSLGTTFPLVQIYTAWGSNESQKFPKIQVESILKTGSIPVITWEPWLTDFNPDLFNGTLKPMETRDKNGLSDVALGLYDEYLNAWAKDAAKVGKPLFIRFGHEMNDPYRYPWGPQNNEASAFVAAWKHVHGVFKNNGANNVIWVWSPHPAYGWFDAYYPGDDFVDWVSVGALNYGTVATWSQWWSFDEIFGKFYNELAAFGKPIMISEFGSLAVGGNRANWYTNALTEMPQKYPMVRGLLFFHFSNDRTTTQQPLDWTIKNDTAIVKAVAGTIAKWR